MAEDMGQEVLHFGIRDDETGWRIEAVLSDYDEYTLEIHPDLTCWEATVYHNDIPCFGPRYFGSDREIAKVFSYRGDTPSMELVFAGEFYDEVDLLKEHQLSWLAWSALMRDLNVYDLVHKHGEKAMQIASCLVGDGVKFEEAIEVSVNV